MESQLPTEEAVREALRSVDDPEVGLNIVDLGLVYRIEVVPDEVRVEMTMTTPACPMGELIRDSARHAVGALLPNGIGGVVVDLVWDPPWSPEMMSDSAKHTFGWSS